MNILILGATGGIGRQIVEQFREDHSLYLVARQEEALAGLAREVGARYKAGDCSLFSFLDEVVQDMVTELGSCDAAVNAIGSILLKPAHLTSQKDFEETWTQNVSTSFALVRSAAKAMMRGQGGSIVLFSSAASRVGMANHEAIACAKGAVEGLARSAAASYAARSVRVNVVAPGLVDTPLASRLTSNPKSLEASIAMHPLGRIATSQEVARAACWLMSPQQSFITGQVLSVDGGLSTLRTRG